MVFTEAHAHRVQLHYRPDLHQPCEGPREIRALRPHPHVRRTVFVSTCLLAGTTRQLVPAQGASATRVSGMAAAKPFDVVLFGATGFTGRFIARTLSRLAGRQRLRIAVAGRDAARLGRIADELVASGDAASRPGVIIADVARPESLEAMATQARAVISAVGPFRHYGAAVVRGASVGSRLKVASRVPRHI